MPSTKIYSTAYVHIFRETDNTGKYLGCSIVQLDLTVSIPTTEIIDAMTVMAREDAIGLAPAVSMEFRQSKVRTTILLGPLLPPNDLPVVWSTPMPSGTYKIDVASGLPAGTTATVLGSPTAAGCTLRVTSTAPLAIGLEIDVTAYR